MIYAEILAGGTGMRMGQTNMPKQFLKIENKPVFIYSTEQFMLNKKVDKILICCSKQFMDYTLTTINTYFADTSRIIVVEGGETRNDTILKGCKYIKENYGINDEDIILTHDAVRPFLTQRMINENIEGTLEYGAVDTVIEAYDTIIHSIDDYVIADIPLRNQMYQGQTPQSFNIKLLMNLFDSLTEKEKNILTDACKVFVMRGIDVHLVHGEQYNFKITTQFDLKIANELIKNKDC